MTDSDRRQKLCADLRDPWVFDQSELAHLAAIAADEIERLEKEVELTEYLLVAAENAP